MGYKKKEMFVLRGFLFPEITGVGECRFALLSLLLFTVCVCVCVLSLIHI